MAERLTCANHPNVATIVRCSKCGKPICPACVIETPVGLRCRECAQLRRIPTYHVSPLQYVRAAGTAVGLALVLGVGWTFLQSFRFFGFYLSFFIALGVGYVMGELVSLSVNRKRGRGLQVVAAVGVFLSYLVSRLSVLALAGMPSLAAAGLLSALLDPFGLLSVAIGMYLAASRIR
ncbi:MAG: hypothetical protein Q8P59_04650 [Dehalococcoidia bacterium]|nr:hypothetical protein [Dehalococcoidia bacterium]